MGITCSLGVGVCRVRFTGVLELGVWFFMSSLLIAVAFRGVLSAMLALLTWSVAHSLPSYQEGVRRACRVRGALDHFSMGL